MDTRLQVRLDKWHQQLEILKPIEERYLLLEGSEKAMEGKLFLSEKGAVKEREHKAHASQDWKDFKDGLAASKSDYLHQKRLLELKIKAYEAEYISLKTEAEAIRKGGLSA